MLNMFFKEILKNAPKDIANLLNDEKFKDVEKIFNIDPSDIKKMFNETKSSTLGEEILSEIFTHLYDAFDTNNAVPNKESSSESESSYGVYGTYSSNSDVPHNMGYSEGTASYRGYTGDIGGCSHGTNRTSEDLNIDEIDKQIKALEVLKANKLKEAELERQHKIQVLADRIVILKSHMKSLHEDLIVDLENGNQEDFQHKTNEMVQVREEIYKLDKEITQIMLSK